MSLNVEKVYCACRICTAKWFCDTNPASCPRCGGDQVIATRAVPPWLRRNPRRRLNATPSSVDGGAPGTPEKDL